MVENIRLNVTGGGDVTISRNVRRSPFFAGTEAAGARGYDHSNHVYVPMDYGDGPDAAYRALTEGVALWDVSIERQTEFSGPGAAELSDYLFSRNLLDLDVDRCCYGFFLDADGVIITDAIVTRLAEDRFWFSPTLADIILWAQGIAIGAGHDVMIRDADYGTLQIQGPRSRDLLRDLIGDEADTLKRFRAMSTTIAGADVRISRTGWTGELGYEIYAPSNQAMPVWDAVMEAGVNHDLLACAYDLARPMEHGLFLFDRMNLYDKITPLEFWRDFLDLDGCEFIGRAALLDTLASGGPRRKVVGLVGETSRPLPSIDDRWDLFDGDQLIGGTRWMVGSPALGKNIAMGLLNIEYADRRDHRITLVHSEGTETMTITDLPFVPDAR